MEVYPNPATETVYIQLEKQASPGMKAVMYDLTGKEVLAQEILTGSSFFSLSLCNFTQGTYIVNIYEGLRITGMAKVVKQ